MISAKMIFLKLNNEQKKISCGEGSAALLFLNWGSLSHPQTPPHPGWQIYDFLLEGKKFFHIEFEE